ncbi:MULTISPECIES: OmpA family protein [unclassified Mesorhizobium]|uniref:OmpA family protein n=1 Tax=unclassified Mesorhizobium TaxID=325217 RepID=UPI000FD27DF3|nr:MULTISPECIES: OmpA family protein [unclassified Mesorhizobium]RVB78979.1 flagellar motor protein MotB [Mesorhizobium sp. M6A.T.Cr.TU.014.01.1.1]RWQ09927.1 MAG: flagellar motor protein MotB [Mesorhizobium sp.]RWQ11361.1 MAG: flagellar motor protein MotB [Mesorhizobium sp.]
MKRQPRILAGTALGLLMASAPLGAFPLQGTAAFGPPQRAATPLILAQSNCPEGESAEGCAQQAEPEQRPRKKRERQSESAPMEQAAPSGDEQEGNQRRKKRDRQQQIEAAPAEQAAPAEEQKPRRKKRDQQQIEAAPADQPAEQLQPRRKKRDRQIEAAPAEQPAEQAAPASDEQQPKPRRKKRDRQQQIEAAPAEQPAEQAAPANDEQQPKPRRKKRDQQQQIEAAPAKEPAGQAAPREKAAPANDNEQVTPRRKKRDQDQQIEAAPSEQPAKKETPAGEPAPQAEPLPTPTDRQAAPAEGEQPLDQARKRGKKPIGEPPVTGEQLTTGEQPAEGEQAAPAEGEGPAQGEAPVFDSQKDAVRKRRGGRNNAQETGGQDAGGQPTQQNGEQAEAPKPAPVDQGPPPTDDRAAQQELKLERMVPVTEEKGKRVERAPDDEDIRRRPRPRGVDVVRELGDRVILQFNNQTIVESDDAPRMHRGARNVYYEELSGDRTREIVERDNGIQIVTIRNRYGDVIQRSRIAPDGREYVLSYVDERYYDDDSDWRDPGDDLPPIRIDIPREEYILDAEDIEDPGDYYTFLEQPPVERVQRLYSIDEVKRSARVRDIARRIDLDTLNFEFGSASIPETEVQKLEGVASAMEKLLEKNPAETFLIEGHTDAVGRPEANLALSDRRAEAVAEALTNAFSIPPENLTTQGYGEEYLKVNTSEPNRENRRVAIRRITSLVAPVASAN